MKKILLLIVMVFAVFVIASCSAKTYKIAMITDSGTIDDKSFNESTWNGIKEYAEENDISHKYYKPTEIGFDAYVASIELAIKNGAEVVVTPGFFFENAIYKVQSENPDVKFILIDGAPHNVIDFDTMDTFDDKAPDFGTITDNTLSIFFQEEQSGFLAGYGVVKEGMRKLGFVGGIAVPAVQRFGIGWIAGAYYAADELDVTVTFEATHYEYLNSFEASPATNSLATTWYNSGVDVIHAAAGGAGNSVMTAAAASSTPKWVVGVDVDQSGQSPRVITSAYKALALSVYEALEDIYNDTFEGGQSITLGAVEDGIGLPLSTEAWRFTTFTQAQYETIYEKLVDGTVVVPTIVETQLTEANPTQLTLEDFLTALGFTPDAALMAKINPATT
jgi:basic membrane protein A